MVRTLKQDIMYQERLNIPYNFLRFATPREVALYRAEKISKMIDSDNKVILEIGSGIGGQTFALSKFFKKVICLEIDKEKCLILKKNLQKLKIFNVEVINGDALNKSVINKLNEYKIDTIFVDTKRPEQSERTLEEIKPSIQDILKNYLAISKNIAVEIPPFTKDLDFLKEEYLFEEEFISSDHTLNRLTLYFNQLKKHERSAISLPSKEIIFSDKEEDVLMKEVTSLKNFKFLYIIDETLTVSNLYKSLAKTLNLSFLMMDKPMFLSEDIISSSFITPFRIKSFVKNNKWHLIKEFQKLNAKKIVLRYNVNPDKYWEIRKEYEKNLKGNKEIHLFFNPKKDYYLLCEKVEKKD